MFRHQKDILKLTDLYIKYKLKRYLIFVSLRSGLPKYDTYILEKVLMMMYDVNIGRPNKVVQ